MNGQSVIWKTCHVIPCLIKMDGGSIHKITHQPPKFPWHIPKHNALPCIDLHRLLHAGQPAGNLSDCEPLRPSEQIHQARLYLYRRRVQPESTPCVVWFRLACYCISRATAPPRGVAADKKASREAAGCCPFHALVLS